MTQCGFERDNSGAAFDPANVQKIACARLLGKAFFARIIDAMAFRVFLSYSLDPTEMALATGFASAASTP